MSDNTTELKQYPITRDELIEKMVEHRGDDWDHHDTDEVLLDGRIGFNEMTNGELEDLAYEVYMMEEDGQAVKYVITDADTSNPSPETLVHEMLEALKLARKKIEMWPEGNNPEYFPEIKAIDAAIARAEGK